MQPTKEEMKLASPCYNAIKAIARERECKKCKGKGEWITDVAPVGTPPEYSEPFTDSCPKCKGTGKVGYVWESEVGEWLYLLKWKRVELVVGIVQHEPGDKRPQISNPNYPYQPSEAPRPHIPILHWEKIEEILEGAGYEVKDQRESSYQSAQCWIYPTRDHPKAKGKDLCGYLEWRRHNVITTFGKSRQEAVMLAVDRLRKELKR